MDGDPTIRGWLGSPYGSIPFMADINEADPHHKRIDGSGMLVDLEDCHT